MKLKMMVYDDNDKIVAFAETLVPELDARILQDVLSDLIDKDAEYITGVFNGEEGNVDEPWDGFNSDAEADADALASAGWGTDEDYGHYGD
jgi:hypothetical protein